MAQLSALQALVARHAAWFAIGAGSNLVLGERVNSLVAHIALKGVTWLGRSPDDDPLGPADIIEAAAGEPWHDFVAHSLAQGWRGLENLALIPGNVGAAPVQNIGAYGVELVDRVHAVRAWDLHAGKLMMLNAAECAFGYRDSRFKQQPDRWVITAVQFRLPRAWRAQLSYPDLQCHPALTHLSQVTATDVFHAVCDIRRAKLPDPAVIGNAGSFFKNPLVDAARHAALRQKFPNLVSYPLADGGYKLAAGWLIDQCGWKGKSLGRAAVHARQALVLTNTGGASADDILALAAAVHADVQARFGVALEIEPSIKC
jgi:UDP-N-acetylmuramate dehydrogenase